MEWAWEPVVEGLERLNVSPAHSDEATVEETWNLWHRKLGHLGENDLKKLTFCSVGVQLEVPERSSFEDCTVCQEFPPISVEEVINERQSDCPGKLLHLHVFQPFPKEYTEEKPFAIIIVDDFSNFCRINFCENDFDMLEHFINFVQESNKQLWTSEVEVVQVEDSTIEFYHALLEWVKLNKIEITTTNKQTPRTNPKASLLLNIVMRTAEAMLYDCPYDNLFWGEGIQAAANLFNSTTIIDEVTPFEKWFGWPPNLSEIKCFGTPVYERDPDNLSVTRYLYVGLEDDRHRVWDPSWQRTKYFSHVVSENESNDQNEFRNDDELPRTANVAEAHPEPLGENEIRNGDELPRTANVAEAHPEPLGENEMLLNVNNQHREWFIQSFRPTPRRSSEEDL